MIRIPRSKLIRVSLLLWLAIAAGPLLAQDLEPRRWSHLPTGLNVAGLGGGWTDGDIFFDPVLLIEDATFDVYPLSAAYVRSFGMLGRSARIDLKVPYARGRWEGTVDGEYTSTRRSGFADPRVRFSINLYGAPALNREEFIRFRREHPVNTTVGFGFELALPLGDYRNDKLINLGGNRLVFRPQLGVLHQRNKWQFELTGSVFLYGNNGDFWNGNTLQQDPLWFLQAHAIYSFKPGWWASLSGGFAHGGRSEVNGVAKTDDRRTRYLAVSLGLPLTARQSIKFTYLTSDTHVDTGLDSNALLAGWSINWGGD